jgi:CheY-like chemotaxis protein
MDLNMPFFDGYEGADMIRKFEKTNKYSPTFITAISADQDIALTTKVKEHKFDSFMKKPIQRNNIIELIEERCKSLQIPMVK